MSQQNVILQDQESNDNKWEKLQNNRQENNLDQSKQVINYQMLENKINSPLTVQSTNQYTNLQNPFGGQNNLDYLVAVQPETDQDNKFLFYQEDGYISEGPTFTNEIKEKSSSINQINDRMNNVSTKNSALNEQISLSSKHSKDSIKNLDTYEGEDQQLQTLENQIQIDRLFQKDGQINEQQLINMHRQMLSKQSESQYIDSPTIKSQKLNLKLMKSDFLERYKSSTLRLDQDENPLQENIPYLHSKVNSPFLNRQITCRHKDSLLGIKKNKQNQHIVYNKYSYKLWKNSQVIPVVDQNENSTTQLKKWNIVNQIGMALKIKQKLMSLVSQKFNKLSGYERKLIGDISDISYNLKQIKSKQVMILQRLFCYKFHPGSFTILLFKVLMLLVTIYNIMYIPLFISFILPFSESQQLIHNISTFLFFAEIIIKFRTSVYDKGEILNKSAIIAKRYFFTITSILFFQQNQIYNQRYLNTGFFTDLISLVGYIIGTQIHFLLLLIVLRVRNLKKYLDDINNHFYLTEKYYQIWVLTKLFVLIIIMNHYFACIFHYIGMLFVDDPSVNSWIKAQNLQDSDWDQRYISALYFSFITCITIGFGDIAPKNNQERLSVVFFSFFSTICFSYSVNTIGNIFQDYYTKFMRYNAINFMSKRNINKDLQMRVLKYIEYIQEIENDSPEDGLSVINKVSNHLKFQLFTDYYGKILKQNKHFALNYSTATINKLALKIQEKLYVPGEALFEQGEQDYRLFYLIKGECEYYLQNKGGNKQSEIQSIALDSETRFFGYKGFISGIPREMSCRSTNLSHVFYIQRDDLISVLKEDPLDYSFQYIIKEQFCKLRDEYQLYSNSLGEQCFGCKSFGHTLLQCSRIHLIRNRQLVVLKYNFSIDQKREPKIRQSRKYYSVSNVDITSFNAKKYRKRLTSSLKKGDQSYKDQNGEENYQDCLASDEEFSKENPYIKFIGEEMILYDQHHSDDDNFQTDEEEESNGSEDSRSVYQIPYSSSQTQLINELNEEFQRNSQRLQSVNEEEDKYSEKDLENTQDQSYLKIEDYNIDQNDQVQQTDNIIKKVENNEEKKQIQQNNYTINEDQNKIQSMQVLDINDECNKELDNQNYITQNFKTKSENNLIGMSQTLNTIQSPSIQNIKEDIIVNNRNSDQYNRQSYSKLNKFMEEFNEKGGQSQQSSQYSLNSQQLIGTQDKEQIQKQISYKSAIQLSKKKQIEKYKSEKHHSDQIISQLSSKKINKLRSLKQIQKSGSQQLQFQVQSYQEDQPFKKSTNSKQVKHDFLRNNSLAQSESNYQLLIPQRSMTRSKTGSVNFNSNNLLDSKIQQTQILKPTLKQKQNSKTQKDNFLQMYEQQNQLLYQIVQSLQNKAKLKQQKMEFQDTNIDLKYNNLHIKEPETKAEIEENIDEEKNIFFNHKYYHKQSIHFNLNKRISYNEANLFLFEFDFMKEYQRYFPHNNASIVCLNNKHIFDRKKRTTYPSTKISTKIKESESSQVQSESRVEQPSNIFRKSQQYDFIMY